MPPTSWNTPRTNLSAISTFFFFVSSESLSLYFTGQGVPKNLFFVLERMMRTRSSPLHWSPFFSLFGVSWQHFSHLFFFVSYLQPACKWNLIPTNRCGIYESIFVTYVDVVWLYGILRLIEFHTGCSFVLFMWKRPSIVPPPIHNQCIESNRSNTAQTSSSHMLENIIYCSIFSLTNVKFLDDFSFLFVWFPNTFWKLQLS